MPRFVILEHDHPSLHWDLMLETEAPLLRTWKLMSPPLPDTVVDVEPSPDHRSLYLNYEGPIGGERGSVHRWDSGTYYDFSEQNDELKFRLQGERFHCICRMMRAADSRWKLQVSSHSVPG